MNEERKLRCDEHPLNREAIIYTEDEGPYYAVAFVLTYDRDENWRRARAAIEKISHWLRNTKAAPRE